MRSRSRSWIMSGLVLAMLAGTQTGCKSGWKMPGADMFSWGRKPSESTIVGNGPSVSTPTAKPSSLAQKTSPTTKTSNTPESPALRSNPTQVNSTAMNAPAGNRPNPTTFGGYGPNTTAGMNAAPGNAPIPGGAASANGYSTGAYATNPTRPSPNGLAGIPPSMGAANLPAPTSANGPYGPPGAMNAPQYPVAQGNVPSAPQGSLYSYPSGNAPLPGAGGALPPNAAALTGLPNAGLPVVSTPNAGLPNAGLPNAGLPNAGLPNAGLPNAGLPGSVPNASMANGGLPKVVAPNGYNMIPPPSSPNLAGSRPAGNAYVPAGPQGLPTVSVSSGASGPVANMPNSQMPVAYGGNVPSSMPTMTPPGSSSPNAYRPGSVGRSNPYDFSKSGPNAAPSAPATGYPRTANDPTNSFNR